MRALGFDQNVNAFVVLLDYRQRAAGCLQDRGELSLDKPMLLSRIAHVTERRAHVERAAPVALEEHIIAAQVTFGRFAGGAQLL